MGIVRSLCHLERQVALLVAQIADMHTAIAEITCGKDWYSTSEVSAMRVARPSSCYHAVEFAEMN